jgi:hypothetical protein
MFPLKVKHVLASSVYLASEMSKKFRDSMVRIPGRVSLLAGHAFPVFIDNFMAKQIDQIDCWAIFILRRGKGTPPEASDYLWTVGPLIR